MNTTLTDDFFSDKLNQTVSVARIRPASGGSINNSFLVHLEQGQHLFIKTHRNEANPGMFRAEAKSLELLAKTDVIAVPGIVYVDDDWLILEAFNEGSPGPRWQETIGRSLAYLHQASQQAHFGFACDTYLGTTLQDNAWQDNWLLFWQQQRLGAQLRLFSQVAEQGDALLRLANQLLDNLDIILACDEEPAVLLHGDLWSGNAAANEQGEPVIFDPASYFGQREAEFGMMRLFGGFGANCEAAYQEIWPLPAGYDRRIAVYQLYHQLNHLNLFGGSYYQGCLSTINAIR